ncbi:MAG: CAP domain-containing protein [bacterium]
MKIYRSILAILLFFVVIYAFKGYLNPSKYVFEANSGATSSSATSSTTLGSSSINYENASSSGGITSTLLNTIKNIESGVGIQSANRDTLPPVVEYNVSNTVKDKLTADGVFADTNNQRKLQSLPALIRSSVLDKSAEIKLNDMFSNQYFEHVSPSGSSVSDVVNAVGYKFLVVGENLALGSFAGDDGVVGAWMASEGHRANILDKRYTEMGVAVGYGMYKGKMQWLAVQHFARPMSSCPAPSAGTKDRITKDKEELVLSESDINSTKKIVDKTESSDPNFQSIINSYNALVNDYNNKLKNLKTEIVNYNSQVNNFNSCLDAVTTSAR